MHQVFESPDADGVLLVDASNAFNCLNRQTALLNIKKLCPTLSKALINTYRENIQLFIDGETILSQCGLKEENTQQVWYADDATAGGKLTHIKNGGIILLR